MSWLRDFLNYRKECPICKAVLPTELSSSKVLRLSNIIDNKIIFAKFELNTFGSSSKEKQSAIIYIDCDTLKLTADFYYTNNQIKEKLIPLNDIGSLKSILKNLSFFSRVCPCERYRYSSHQINFDWKTGFANVDSKGMGQERLSIQRIINGKMIFFEITNDLNDEDCMVFYGSIPYKEGVDASIFKNRLDALDPTFLPGELTIPSLKVDEWKETIDKIETYIVFS